MRSAHPETLDSRFRGNDEGKEIGFGHVLRWQVPYSVREISSFMISLVPP